MLISGAVGALGAPAAASATTDFRWTGDCASLEATTVGTSQGSVAVVADVRLDNRAELCAGLSLDRGADDASILLAAWRRWDLSCSEWLRGDFAFAVWDDHTGRLYCGRDLVGVKPLYYWTGPQGAFAFASQLAPLLACGAIERRLDTAAAIERLLFLQHDTGRTLFAGIRRLPPGHALVVRPGGRPHIWRHTRLEVGDVGSSSPEEGAARLRDAVVRAVADRLPSDGLVGAHVSGGLDSSSVAGVAASLLPAGRLVPMTFSATRSRAAEGEAPVDARFLDDVAGQLAVPIHQPPADLLPFPAALERAAPGMMPPPYATSSANRWAGEAGVRSVLTGWGGDEAASFSGRTLLSEAVRRGKLGRVVPAARALNPGRSFSAGSLVGSVVEPLLPDRLYWWARFAQGDPWIGRLRTTVANERTGRDAGLLEALHHPWRTRATARGTQLSRLRSGHLVARMESWSADASRFGVDYHYPLLDRRVLEVALGAPWDSFLREGSGRWLLRTAMAPYLPPSLASRQDKEDGWGQRGDVAFGAGAGVGFDPSWVRAEAERLLREGNDLGGAVDLRKLRARLAGSAPRRFATSPVANIVPLLLVAPAAQLAAFVRHHRMAT